MKNIFILSALMILSACNPDSEFSEKLETPSIYNNDNTVSNDVDLVDPAAPENDREPAVLPDPVILEPDPVQPDPVQPAPVIVAPAPVQPAPVIVAPAPVQPAPVVVAPAPVQPAPVVVAPDPVQPDPTSPDAPINPIANQTQSCKYSFSATHVGDNVGVTIISGPLQKLLSLDNADLQKLAIEDRNFIVDALNKKLGISAVSSKSSTLQNVSEKLLIQNTNFAKASFTHVKDNIKLSYSLQGENASIKGTSIAQNSKLFAVLDAKKSSVEFTSLAKGVQIFLIMITQGDNISCISTTGVDGNMHSYIYGEDGFMTQSQLKATSIKGSSIIQHVSGKSNTKAFLKGTSISDSSINIKVDGLANTGSMNQFTGMGNNNTFNVDLNGKDMTTLDLSGTFAGHDTKINLNITGLKDSGAAFSFTAESNISLNGIIKGEMPYLNMSENLTNSSTTSKNITLQQVN